MTLNPAPAKFVTITVGANSTAAPGDRIVISSAVLDAAGSHLGSNAAAAVAATRTLNTNLVLTARTAGTLGNAIAVVVQNAGIGQPIRITTVGSTVTLPRAVWFPLPVA